MSNPADLPWIVLNGYVRHAIASHPSHIAWRLAAAMNAGLYRLMCDVGLDEDGEPDPATLVYIVEIKVSDGGFATLCTVPAALLMMSAEEVDDEIASLRLQNGIGIPDDLSEIT